MPLTEKILDISSNLLIVFKILVDNFNLVDITYNTFPKLINYINPPIMTILLTVIVGIILVFGIFFILVNMCRITLNITIFLKWSVIGILAIGVINSVLM